MISLSTETDADRTHGASVFDDLKKLKAMREIVLTADPLSVDPETERVCESECDTGSKKIEMIACLKPDRAERGYAIVMYNISNLSDKDIAAGKGCVDPYLCASVKSQHAAKDRESLFTAEQLNTIETVGNDKSFVDCYGIKYVPFKSDIEPYSLLRQDETGQIVKYTGFMPVIDTVEPSDLEPLSEDVLERQWDNIDKSYYEAEKQAQRKHIRARFDKVDGISSHGDDGHSGSDGEQFGG